MAGTAGDALKNLVGAFNESAGEFVGRGTHDGTLMSPQGELPPTGKRLEERFSVVIDVSDGKITGVREYYDVMTLMAQLGLLPEPAQAT